MGSSPSLGTISPKRGRPTRGGAGSMVSLGSISPKSLDKRSTERRSPISPGPGRWGRGEQQLNMFFF